MKKTQKIMSIIIAAVIVLSTFVFTAIGAEPVKGTDVALFACSLEGSRYQYSGKGPDKFDCSGFVFYVLGNFGIEGGNSTADYNTKEKAAKFGTVIEDISDAKPGDIIVWGSHLGIYLGDGLNISSLNAKTGVCVRAVSDFRDKHGVKNPSHFFIRPYDYVEETEEETVEETEVQEEVQEQVQEETQEKVSFIDRIKAKAAERRERIRIKWEAFIAKF